MSTPTDGEAGLLSLARYFLRLGALGFGGPVALVGYMHRDLVQQRRWISTDTYSLALALGQIMPGPLAAQTAIAIGYFQSGIVGATVVAFAFILPSFLMVLALSWLYVANGGLWWMQAIFYGVGAAVIAIIAITAYRLARSTNRRDPLLWSIFGVLTTVTIVAQAELAVLFVMAGLVAIGVKARPRSFRVPRWRHPAAVIPIAWPAALTGALPATALTGTLLVEIFLFFAKAGLFVFGSGLAIIPFLYEGVVQQRAWLNEQQFLDAVAVAMITPGPVVITVAFIGYLVAGLSGATIAAIGMFLPVYLLTIIPAPWFKRHRENAQLRAFVLGATAAATGAISGAVVVLGRRSIHDLPTFGIMLVSLLVLWRFRPPEPLVVVAAGAIGLLAWQFRG
ncbi:MAG: chromate transporter [Dehalococcoidia bacterium]|nr:chromate transporter [Dehalococcoidia bacterium]